MNLRNACTIAILASVVIQFLGCKKTTDNNNDCPVGFPPVFNFSVVNNDTTSVFPDTSVALQLYYFKDSTKYYIHDLIITPSTDRYHFTLSSPSISQIVLDSIVNNYYLERPGGVIDSINLATRFTTTICVSKFVPEIFTCKNAVTYEDSTVLPYRWIIIEH